MLHSGIRHGAEISLLHLLCIMYHNQIDILGVSETNWRGHGHMRYTIYVPGREENRREQKNITSSVVARKI